MSVQAMLNNVASLLATLTVLAPSLGNANFDYEDLACTDHVPITFTFQNSGDGSARNVAVTVAIFNANNVQQDTKTTSAGNVPAGASGSASFDLFAPDSCGRDDYYHVTFTATPQYGDALEVATQPFSL